MKIKNLKIGTQLKLGLAFMLLLVIALGATAYIMCDRIQLETETLYNHPLMVRRAIDKLHVDIITIQRDMKDLFLADDEKKAAADVNRIDMAEADASAQLDILYSRFLGPRADVDSVKQAFVIWNSMCDESIRLFRQGRTKEAVERSKNSGVEIIQSKVLLAALQKVDDFAVKKGDALFASSVKLTDSLNRQLVILTVVILLLAVILNLVLLRNIRKPLEALADAARRFHDGETDARCAYDLKNEFGELTASFNTMAEGVQQDKELAEKLAGLAGLMLSEYDTKKFFQATLNALAAHTGSQMAAIYLLSDDKKRFEHFESTGVDDNARQSFAADRFEGEFGPALASRKIQHIKIPDDTRFIFHTVSGKFIPREIITIPILADNEVVAVISLAGVGMYSKQSVQLIDRILVTLCARVEGILAYHKIKEFSKQMEHQNRELETQKQELSAQASELMEQNTELEMQKTQLNEASQLKTNFLSNMSHELRTPLNSVIALSGVLNRRLASRIPEEEYSYLEVIERNGKHLLELINDILDISRIEAGREDMEITQFDVNNLIAEVVSMIQPQAEQKKIELLHPAGDAELLITGDADKCRHILQNLIGNAVKFTEKGKVEITAARSGGNILIKVTDTGIGISENHLVHIFDKFRQADGSTSRRFGGTGLGLAIARELAALLGGAIAVKSVSGRGSEFTLSLPVNYTAANGIIEAKAAAGFKKTIKQTAHKPAAGAPAKTILLVEDSEPAIIQMKDFLEAGGYGTLVARNGGEALEIIGKTVPDAMILDLMMPGVDGFEVLKTIREAELTAHIPVLILTAKHISKEELKFLKRNNIYQLIQKGNVNRNELLDTVAGMVFPEPAEPVKPQFKPQIINGRPVVLVVEDNPDNMITMKALLADNYAVIEAVDGIEAIEKAKQNFPNLILMDVALPGMDGIEAFKAIRQLPELQHVPVIAITASAMVNDRETILAHGFDAYISKPIDEHLFSTTINEALYGK
ncbi:MAG: response regulator [Lentisphaerota bacterium]